MLHVKKILNINNSQLVYFVHTLVTKLELYRGKSSKKVIGAKYVLSYIAAAAAKSLQSCPTLCDPMDCSPPGFSIQGILQAKTLEWVAISFSNA